VPQSFLYIESLPGVHALARESAFAAAFGTRNSFELRRITPENERDFRKQVQQHISKSYKETGAKYADAVLTISNQGHDAEGFLTTAKHTLEIHYGGSFVGYLVLTAKSGGAIKTGPLILFEEFRRKGLGQALRQYLHLSAKDFGARKVYCTVPENKPEALGYLLKAGYRIEAHLEEHYHTDHDEIVLSYSISDERDAPPDIIRPLISFGAYSRLTKEEPEVACFIVDEFSALYAKVNGKWATRIIRESLERTTGKFKPKAVYVGRGVALNAVVLCVEKRGGSVKVIMLTKSDHVGSLVGLLEYVETQLGKRPGLRKLYSHVALADRATWQAYLDRGFKLEGVLDRPYYPGIDMLVFGKIVSHRAKREVKKKGTFSPRRMR
jgi:RimJ/RimL family protein N-acetyltransferase